MKTPESWKDQRSRLESMVSDKGDTWDLSPNDKAAISAVLNRLDTTAAEMRRLIQVAGEGGSRGRAMDLIPVRDWQRALAALADAEMKY